MKLECVGEATCAGKLTLTATAKVEPGSAGRAVLGIYIENAVATKHLGLSTSVGNAGSVTWQVTPGTLAAP